MRHALEPIWIGIAVNILFAAANAVLIGNHGKWPSRWVRYSPLLLVAIWAVLVWAFITRMAP